MFAAPETEEEHEAGKGTEKTLERVIAPGVKLRPKQQTTEDPQVEIVEMEVEQNWEISLKQLHLNRSRLMIAVSSTTCDRKRWPTQHQRLPNCGQGQVRQRSPGNIYTAFETVSAVVSWESHTRTFTFSDHSLWRGKTAWETPIEIDCGVAIFFVMEAYGLICTSCHWATNIPATQTCLSKLRCTIKFTVERQPHS